MTFSLWCNKCAIALAVLSLIEEYVESYSLTSSHPILDIRDQWLPPLCTTCAFLYPMGLFSNVHCYPFLIEGNWSFMRC